MRPRHLTAIPLLAGLLAGATPATAHAAGSATGAITVDAVATLATSPCTAPVAPCSGSLDGWWSGQLAGTSGGVPYTVTWATALPAMAGLAAGFTYSDGDCGATSGSAAGSGTAAALPGQITGSWQIAGEPFPRAVTGITMSFGIQWSRTATLATVSVDPVSVVLDVAGLGPQTVLTAPQQGAAVFGSVPPASCTSPSHNATVPVVIAMPVAG